MARDRAYRRFRARLAKKRAGLLFLIWRCGEGLPPESAELFRRRWIGLMANCHCTPCSCFMCGNVRRISGEPTPAERRSARHMREVLEDEFGMTA